MLLPLLVLVGLQVKLIQIGFDATFDLAMCFIEALASAGVLGPICLAKIVISLAKGVGSFIIQGLLTGELSKCPE